MSNALENSYRQLEFVALYVKTELIEDENERLEISKRLKEGVLTNPETLHSFRQFMVTCEAELQLKPDDSLKVIEIV